MPHVIVKLWAGRGTAEKQALSDAILHSVTGILGYGEDAVSIGFEDVAPGDWDRQVYAPDVAAKWASLTKKPGYGTPPAEQER
jgi:4-oxalocrotonate tautomerase